MCYFLHRACLGLFLLGFSMVPGTIVLHFWGPVAGVIAVAVWPMALALSLIRSARSRGETIWSFLTSECELGWQSHPALTLLCGTAFVAAGLWIIFLAPDRPLADPQRMTSTERSWFGTVFALLGLATDVGAISLWLAPCDPSALDESPAADRTPLD